MPCPACGSTDTIAGCPHCGRPIDHDLLQCAKCREIVEPVPLCAVCETAIEEEEEAHA